MSPDNDFTPGPWKRHANVSDEPGVIPVSTGSEIRNGGFAICTCYGPDAGINARAIAALPDLVEALKMFVWPYHEKDRHDETERQEIGRAALDKLRYGISGKED